MPERCHRATRRDVAVVATHMGVATGYGLGRSPADGCVAAKNASGSP